MKNLRTSIIFFSIGLAIFFNIERLDLIQENTINLDSFIYVLGLVAVISTIAVPVLRKSNLAVSIVLWATVYFVSKYFLGNPLLGGIYIYLSITELSLLLIIVWLSHRLAASMMNFEDAVERITFPNLNHRRIRNINEANEEIQVEMFRSRHNHHPMSVIVIKPELASIKTNMHRMVQEVQQEMMSSYVINNMAQTISKFIRRSDLVIEQHNKDRFIVLCPETNATDAELMVDYINTMAEEQLGTSISYGTATFPDEAITFDELLKQAESHMKQDTQQESLSIEPDLATSN